ncbi:metallophosphoesterase family protein [Actinomycetospora cinnamomea]|uniref:DNA repair exonuclease SbcCD nuclease subunit n=1 Tax=Actinomycetospora cinnamomea TaxID=663609 RepID=A0A2U1F1C1_9PSEU|nr:metallophosphoesterase [Actinomycetospora cinnamomea]PVZ05810.1 DNA repair exonuclease SbcCD nuclease subunit [Actinomycetospora cinnamomea]
MRFVHTADWQLGMTRRYLGARPAREAGGPTGEAQARFAEARLDAVRALGRIADEADAAFVLVCGDVFESNLVGPEVVARACEALGSFRTPVLLLPGNHDPADASCLLRRPDFVRRRPPHVTVLDTPGVHAVAPGVEVVAAPWRSKHPLSDLVGEQLAALDPAPPGTLRVVAGHGELDVLDPDDDEPARIRRDGVLAALADGRVHYVALGDRHSAWADAADDRIRHAGTPEVTDFDEVDPGHVLVVDLDEHAARVRTETVGRWRFVRHYAALDTDADLDALDAWLAARADKERTAVRLVLRGTLSLRQRTRLDELLGGHGHAFASLEILEPHSDLATVPDDADLDALDLHGFAADAAAELFAAAGRASEGAGDVEARDALRLLHRLVGS